jgi:hypothetical protein
MTSAFRAPRSLALYILTATALVAWSFWDFDRALLARTGGAWAPPLDDAFIHAQFARNAATGHPLEWMAGEGISSGGTSILWPLLLALPWGLGARGVLIVPAAHALAAALLVVAFALVPACQCLVPVGDEAPDAGPMVRDAGADAGREVDGGAARGAGRVRGGGEQRGRRQQRDAAAQDVPVVHFVEGRLVRGGDQKALLLLLSLATERDEQR